jgi:hypothetical protein
VLYPSPTNTGNTYTFADSPYIPLYLPIYGDSEVGEGARPSFKVVTYLLWDPTIPAGCVTGVNCDSIPVPLGTLTWGYLSDAIDSLANYAQDVANGLTPPAQTSPADWSIYCGTGVNQAPPNIQLVLSTPSKDPVNFSYPRWQNRDKGYATCQ